MFIKKDTLLLAVALTACFLLSVPIVGPSPDALLLAILFTISLVTLVVLRWQVRGAFADAFLSPYGLIPVALVVMLVSRALYYVVFFEAGIGLLPRVLTRSEYITVASWGAAFVSLFLVGYLSAGMAVSVRRRILERPKAKQPKSPEVTPPRALIAAFSLVGLVGTSLILAKNDWNYVSMVMNPSARTSFNQGTGYLQGLVRFLPAALLLYVTRQACARRINKTGLACFGIATLLVLVPFGQRSQLFFPLLSLLVLINYLGNGFSVRTLAAVVTLAIAGLGAFSAYRRVTSMAGSNQLEDAVSLVHSLPTFFDQLTKAFNPIDSLFALVQGEQKLWLGETYLYVVPQAIPSVLWPEKSAAYDSVGYFVSSNYFPGLDAGFPPTVVGELYLNFGAPGVILGGFFIGLAVMAATRLLSNKTSYVFRGYAFALLAPALFLLAWGSATVWFQVLVKDSLILGLAYAFWGRNNVALTENRGSIEFDNSENPTSDR